VASPVPRLQRNGAYKDLDREIAHKPKRETFSSKGAPRTDGTEEFSGEVVQQEGTLAREISGERNQRG